MSLHLILLPQLHPFFLVDWSRFRLTRYLYSPDMMLYNTSTSDDGGFKSILNPKLTVVELAHP